MLGEFWIAIIFESKSVCFRFFHKFSAGLANIFFSPQSQQFDVTCDNALNVIVKVMALKKTAILKQLALLWWETQMSFNIKFLNFVVWNLGKFCEDKHPLWMKIDVTIIIITVMLNSKKDKELTHAAYLYCQCIFFFFWFPIENLLCKWYSRVFKAMTMDVTALCDVMLGILLNIY